MHSHQKLFFQVRIHPRTILCFGRVKKEKDAFHGASFYLLLLVPAVEFFDAVLPSLAAPFVDLAG